MKFLRASLIATLLMWASSGVLPSTWLTSTVSAQTPSPQAPMLMRIDGQLTAPTGEPRTGEVVLVVSIYTEQADPAPVWSEEHQVTLGAGGKYTLTAGATQPDGIPKEFFLSGTAHWVGVGVLNENNEQPRFMLVSVPYAMKARESDTVAGKNASDFVLSANLAEAVKSAMQNSGSTIIAGGANGPSIASTPSFFAKFTDAVGTVGDTGVIETGGNIGIGTTTPFGKLQVRGPNAAFVLDDAAQNKQWYVSNSGGGLQISRFDNGAFVATRFSLGTDANNVVGFNTANTTAQLNAVAASAGIGALYLQSIANATVPTIEIKAGPSQLSKLTEWKSSNGTVLSVVDALGNVGIGTDTPTAKLQVAGDALINGNIAAKYQDVAEWVETPSDLESGTVVIIDPDEPNRVVPSSKAYDTRVAGAVSAQPGLILGERSASKEMVAQSGRVRIKVDATQGAIKIGDLLVTSPTPGYAMLSKPIKVGGQLLHRPGTLLGKALEPMPSGKGEILVLLTLQ